MRAPGDTFPAESHDRALDRLMVMALDGDDRPLQAETMARRALIRASFWHAHARLPARGPKRPDRRTR